MRGLTSLVGLIGCTISGVVLWNALVLVHAYNTSESLNDVSPYTFSMLHIASLCLMPVAIIGFGWLAVKE